MAQTFDSVAELHDIAAGLYTTNALRGWQLSSCADKVHAVLVEKDRRIEQLERERDILRNSVEQYGRLASLHDNEIAALEAERDSAKAQLIALATVVLPKLGHPVQCGQLNPTEEWKEKGSMNFDNCTCEIALVKAALTQSGQEALARSFEVRYK